MVYNFFEKKSSGSSVGMHGKNKIKQNHQLPDELHKLVVKKIQW